MYSVTIMMCLTKRETKNISSQRKEHKQCEQNGLWLISVVCLRLFHSHLVTTPSRRMIFGCENWPMMLASLKKSCLCFSEYPGLRVLIATGISPRTRVFITPRKTSPNSPDWQRKSGKNVRAIAVTLLHRKQITFKSTYRHRWLFVCWWQSGQFLWQTFGLQCLGPHTCVDQRKSSEAWADL